MAYSAADARQRLLDAVAEATDEMSAALAALGEAYELVDEHTADVLEEQLFGPAQRAYGRAQRVHGAFADRYDLARREFEGHPPPLPSTGARALVEQAVEHVARADLTLGELQDSMLPVEVGDVELRTGLAEVRTLLGEVPPRARELVRTLGR